jgi:hypothetical protein
MASHGVAKERAVTEPSAPKAPKKEFDHMELKEAENGGAVATHHFTSYEHKPEIHAFGKDEGHKLSAHIEKHLGIKMPGKSSTDSAEETEGDQE